MSKQTEALKLALEALEESLGYVQEEAENAQRLYGQYPARQARIQGLKDDARKHMDAITAIREALAEQCVCGEPDTLGTHRTDGPCLAEQPAQPSKPLTDEQILSLVPGLQDCLCDPWDYNNSGDYYASIPKDMIRLARAIEAAHGIKEKNT